MDTDDEGKRENVDKIPVGAVLGVCDHRLWLLKIR